MTTPGPRDTRDTRDTRDLHDLIDRLEPGQVDELRTQVERLVRARSRFQVLRPFDGPAADLGARAKELVRAEQGGPDADR